jgi:hypothetical protein
MLLSQPPFEKVLWEQDTTTEMNAKYGESNGPWTWSTSSDVIRNGEEGGFRLGYIVGLLNLEDS